ncbi:MAG: DUF2723 domain-containing protein [Deltaproteobacteria bacterium]|nr:DUF2723 domain-containing protein [Deltaproteobacteria bacterium]
MVRTRIAAVAVFLIVFGVYLSAVCPTIHLGDSGELSAAGATLSIPHVPGYPLLTQWTYAVSRLPTGSLAFRTNLASVLAASLGCVMIFLLLRRVTRDDMAAFAVTLAFAGGQMFMEQSLKIRTYPINTALSAALFYLALLWRDKSDRRYLYAAAFLLGVGLTNHQILLAAAMFPAVVGLANIKRLTPRDVVLCAGLTVLGLSTYLYLPLRAITDPVLNWGDPVTWPRFLDALTQQQYKHKMLSSDWEPKFRMAGIILQSLTTQAGLPVFGLASIGVWRLWKTDRVVLTALFVVIAVNIGIRVNYIGKDEFYQVLRYTITATLCVAVAAAYALAWLKDRTGSTAWAATLVVTACVPILQNYARNDLSHHYVGEAFNKAVLQYPEDGYAVAVGGDNNIFPLWFYTRVERYREDVVLIPKAGMDTDWIQAEVRERLGHDWTARPEYARVPLSPFYSLVEDLRERGRPVYSTFSSTEHPVEEQVLASWNERGLVARCGFGFRLDGRPCPAGLWEHLPTAAYTEPYFTRDHHTTTVQDNVVYHFLHHGRDALENGDQATALADFRKAALALPDDPKPRAIYLNELVAAGKTADAKREAADMRRRFADNDAVLQLLAKLGLADAT